MRSFLSIYPAALPVIWFEIPLREILDLFSSKYVPRFHDFLVYFRWPFSQKLSALEPPRFAGPPIRISKFMSYLIARGLLSVFSSLQSGTVSGARVPRGRSLIKLLKDFRPETRIRIAIRGFRTNFRFYLCLSLSHVFPHSFCRPSTQHPTPCILLELHSPPRSHVNPIARELRDSAERGSPFGKLNPVSNPPGVFPATRLTRCVASHTSVSSFAGMFTRSTKRSGLHFAWIDDRSSANDRISSPRNSLQRKYLRLLYSIIIWFLLSWKQKNESKRILNSWTFSKYVFSLFHFKFPRK